MIRLRNCRVRASRGSREHLRRRPLLEDLPAVEEADPVRDVAGEAHLVGRDDHRHARRPRVPRITLEHLGDELRVERRGDLVEQQDVGLHGERPDDRDPLLLAARQLVGVVASALSARPNRSSSSRASRSASARDLPQDLARRERHVVEHRHVREQVERLEHDPDRAAGCGRR